MPIKLKLPVQTASFVISNQTPMVNILVAVNTDSTIFNAPSIIPKLAILVSTPELNSYASRNFRNIKHKTGDL